MKIEIGKYYVNKTWKYLVPCFKAYDEKFIKFYSNVFKLAIGVHDTLLDYSIIDNKRCVFFMFDTKINNKFFEEFLNYLKYQEYYITDYCPESEIINSRKHMIVLQVPEKYNNAYDMFLQGKYSLMYTQKDIDLLFDITNKINEINVLTKKSTAKKIFIDNINKEFNTTINDVQNTELDLPLKICEEIFNCCKETKQVFFNDKIEKTWQ